jgi:ADP-heptose:LPS heptosyltransferase
MDLKVRYNVLEESKEFASCFLKAKSIQGSRVIAVNISPGEGTRFWGTERYQALIHWLRSERPENPVLVLYQPADKAVAESIVLPFPDVFLSPETKTFDQFAALVQQMWMLITPDTSAVHLVAAFSIPSVVLYVQSDKDLRIWEPYRSLSETLVTDIDDLRTIPVDQVTQACQRLVSNLMPPPSSTSQSATTSR